MAYTIPAKHYDGRRHVVPFTVGDDFASKLAAYKADGFTYALFGQTLHVCKIMFGDDLPEYAQQEKQ